MTAAVAFAVAAALHLGFQATVTALTYPALARVPAESWTEVHARHSRGIVPLVAVVYAGLLGTGGWLLATSPSTLAALAAAAGLVPIAVTAVAAAPLHGRLTTPDPALLRRLLLVDRLRAAGGLACLALAVAVVARSS